MKKTIGNTPLKLSSHLTSSSNCRVFVKEEYYNPGASSKDRVADYMIADAEKEGLLRPGYTVVEASSGNTAIGLAMICKQKGYKCVIFMNSSGSQEKVEIIESLGGRVVRCKTSGGPEDPESSQYHAARYAASTANTYYCNQYFNQSNVRAHFESTGPELWQQSQGRMTHFICGVGTGGTISGVAQYLASRNHKINIIAVDPFGSLLSHYFNTGSCKTYVQGNYKIEGIGRSFLPGTLDFSLINAFVQVNGAESAEACHEYYHHTGFAPGFSSGAVIAAFKKLKDALKPDDQVVLFFADNGDRYRSKLYNPEWLRSNIFDEQTWSSFIKHYYTKPLSYV